MGMKETIVEALKDLVLPELDVLKGEAKELKVRLTAVERRLEDFSDRVQGIDQHLIDQSRRIDEARAELTACMDKVHADLTARIDKVHADLTARMDKVHTELIVRTDKVNADLTARIDQQATRIDSLTGQVSALAQQMAGLRSDREVQADILQRLRRLEDKAAA